MVDLRPSATGKITIAGKKDGTITAIAAETYGTGGITGAAGFPFPYVYGVENTRRVHSDVAVNGGNARAMRAPGKAVVRVSSSFSVPSPERVNAFAPHFEHACGMWVS
jgi:hypothetical protein